jgi:putative transcriptional regulator
MKKIKKQPMKGRTDWAKVGALTEKQIVAAAKSDPDARLLTKAELAQFKPVNAPKTANVKLIREKLHLSQEEFATYFAVKKRTVQEWEQGRRAPTSTARVLLKIIEKEPKLVQRVLASSHHS